MMHFSFKKLQGRNYASKILKKTRWSKNGIKSNSNKFWLYK